MRIFGRMGFFLKKATVVESITHVDTVVFDKTGTITYTDLLSVDYQGKKLSEKEEYYIKSLSRQSKHPLSTAVFEFINVAHYSKEVIDYREIPASGTIGIIDGKTIRLGSAKFIKCQPIDNKEIASVVYVSIDEENLGCFLIKNKYRQGIENVIDSLKEHFELHLISGDNDAEKTRMQDLFGTDTNIRFNQSPVDKLEYIKELKAKGKHVLMIGDGLNDAGALNESHVGISIADDIFSFSPACDAILEAEKFAYLPDFLLKTKSSLKVVYASFGLSLLYNVVGLYFAVTGQLSPIIAAILMPISSVSVVAFVTILTNFNLRKMRRVAKQQKVMMD